MKFILWLAIALYIVFYEAFSIYGAELDIFNLTNEQSTYLYVMSLIRDIAYVVACFLMVVIAIFLYLETKQKKYKHYLALALVINLFGIAMSVYWVAKLADVKPFIRNDFSEEPELLDKYQALLDSKDIDISELSQKTHIYASMFYNESGVHLNVVDTNGKQVKFIPTEIQIENRQNAINADNLLAHQKKAALYGSYLNALILCLAVIVGWFSVRIRNAYLRFR